MWEKGKTLLSCDFFCCSVLFWEQPDNAIQNGLRKYLWKNTVWTAEHLWNITCLYFLKSDSKSPQWNNLLSPLFYTTILPWNFFHCEVTILYHLSRINSSLISFERPTCSQDFHWGPHNSWTIYSHGNPTLLTIQTSVWIKSLLTDGNHMQKR